LDNLREFKAASPFMSVARQRKLHNFPSDKPAKRQFSALERAQHNQKKGLEMSRRLFLAATMNYDARAMAEADCIAETASSDNHYFSKGQINYKTGEEYAGRGILVETTASRLCPASLEKYSRRARKRMREALARVEPKPFQKLLFITLTLPNLQTNFGNTLEVLFRAFSLLKKRKFFAQNVSGAIYGYESTVGTENHHHSHVHILGWSHYLDWEKLGAEWTDCVEKACAEIGVKCVVNTSHGRMIVDVRLAKEKASGRDTIAVEDALQEVVKYSVKGSDLAKIPLDELYQVGKVLHRRRLVDTYGECNLRKGKAEPSKNAESEQKRAVSDYLDTPRINDGEKVKVKVETVVEVGTRMILDGKRAEFRRWLKRKMQERRAFRKRQLALLYPDAKFCTLAGAVWSADDYLSKKLPENVVYLQDWGKVRA
jgi:hypothetical protein